MEPGNLRARLVAAALPLFARKGLHGVSVRELARAGNGNLSMISYHFGGKAGLYEAVLRQVFSGMLRVAETARSGIDAEEKFAHYIYRCGICCHTGDGEEFIPHTASADRTVPECPRCLNNDAESFDQEEKKAVLAA